VVWSKEVKKRLWISEGVDRGLWFDKMKIINMKQAIIAKFNNLIYYSKSVANLPVCAGCLLATLFEL
jgi:hypothetical protein